MNSSLASIAGASSFTGTLGTATAGVGATPSDTGSIIQFSAAAPGGQARGIGLASIDSGGASHLGVEVIANGQGKIAAYDTSGGLGIPLISIYIGTTDPATVGGITVNNGDVWLSF